MRVPDADIALAARGSGQVDVSERDDADVPLERGGELPFTDRAISSIRIGDMVSSWSVRDKVQLVLECRRVLAPGAELLLVEPGAAETFQSLARWAALIGLVPLPPESEQAGWVKRRSGTDPSPLVSILIPSSNPRYFLECLDSAIEQSYPNVEIVICDDSEGDVIRALAASRAELANIRFVQNFPRLHARGNYEKLLTLARGEYIKFLNDDDVLEPHCVETLLRAFLEVPDLVLATSHRQPIDAASRPIGDIPATRPVVASDSIVSGVSLANAMIMYGLNIVGEPSTMMFRRRDFDPRAGLDNAGPFHFNGAQVRGAVDFAMASRVLVQGNAAFFHERLSRFRMHSEQAQARPDVVARSIIGIRELQRQWIELGVLFRRMPPGLLEIQPFPAREAEYGDWQLRRWGSLAHSSQSSEEEVRAWQRIDKHPFDFV